LTFSLEYDIIYIKLRKEELEMNKKTLRRLVNLYDDIYSTEPYPRVKIVSFLVYKGKIVSWGVNSNKTNPIQYHYRMKTDNARNKNYVYDKIHSEIDCMNRLRSFSNFDKAELVIISKKKDGHFRLAKPCPICRTMIQEFGIKNIYYTTYEDVFLKEIEI
jgi:deoxycytidylate deaminase